MGSPSSVPRKTSVAHRAVTAAVWPVGVLLTGYAYMWRTTPMTRHEIDGTWEEDRPPELTTDVDQTEVQRAEDGNGDYLRRRYRAVIAEPRLRAAQVMEEVQADPNVVVPNTLARFSKTVGEKGRMEVGDEFLIRMPGPWDGPVRVCEVTPTSFRFLTLDGHIEAGQIAWRARDEEGGRLAFEIESWSRPGDLLSQVMHHQLKMAKEVQLHMWISVLERVIRRYGGRRDGPVDMLTRRVDMPVA